MTTLGLIAVTALAFAWVFGGGGTGLAGLAALAAKRLHAAWSHRRHT